MHEFSPHKSSDVRKLSQRQYENVWNGNAHIRRQLYAYDVPPWESRPSYNIWMDMADRLELESADRIDDIGTNDGYFQDIVRYKGFKGWYNGIDIEKSHIDVLSSLASFSYPQFKTTYMQGDGQNLRGKIEDSSTPRVVSAFVAYHARKPGRIMSEAHRILKPDGLAVFSSRNATNQLDTWEYARETGHKFGYFFPQELDDENNFIESVPIENISVYSHFDVSQLKQSLESSKKFEIVHEHLQDGELYIPNTKSDFYNYGSVILSLIPYMVNKDTRNSPRDNEIDEMEWYINTFIRQSFEDKAYEIQAKHNLAEPYFLSHVSQGFFVVRAIK